LRGSQVMNDYIGICRHQISAGVILMAVLALAGEYVLAASCLFGALLMAAGSWELARRLKASEALDADGVQASLYKGAVLRFMLILAGLATGFLLGLSLPAIAGGMFAAQVLFYIASLRRYSSEARD